MDHEYASQVTATVAHKPVSIVSCQIVYTATETRVDEMASQVCYTTALQAS